MMKMSDLRHVLIVCAARTGGTWVGKLFDTLPNVKYVWEPDVPEHHVGPDNFLQWNFDDASEIWARVKLHRPHVKLDPSFPKTGDPQIAVHKIMGPIGYGDKPCEERWKREEFERIRARLGARVLHLTRHPLRWWASVVRWKPDLGKAFECVRSYMHANLDFYNRYHGKDWYQVISHEGMTMQTKSFLEDVFHGLGIVSELPKVTKAFLDICHVEDHDPHADHHSCVMTQETVMSRWKSLTVSTVEMINSEVRKMDGAESMFGNVQIGE